ncbi:125 kDa kinesin-related protein [Platanthera guangdongensis]|uniref:125 kDa kinesin-related protein n=1 Tax=Platanthera guangdongensis TaxID=2320717 RepID=A0ABR2LFG7_9ASPA
MVSQPSFCLLPLTTFCLPDLTYDSCTRSHRARKSPTNGLGRGRWWRGVGPVGLQSWQGAARILSRGGRPPFNRHDKGAGGGPLSATASSQTSPPPLGFRFINFNLRSYFPPGDGEERGVIGGFRINPSVFSLSPKGFLMDSSQKKGSQIPISPSQTPRSGDRLSKGSNDSSNNSNSKQDKEKGVNVQVIVRCRPLNDGEMRVNTPTVISCNEQHREISAVQSIANKQIDKTFTFDKVFGPSSLQNDLFEQAVSPIVSEVLEGYNCTIFAYGQTGTGKTYTMEGGVVKAKSGEFPSDAGVIPRSVRGIFDKLEAQNAEYSMKVTFLELYNEEITDLLAPDELKILQDKLRKPITLMEDGKKGVFVKGLEEEIVTTASEIYKILEKGSSKRRTAETLLNKQSSRSHSIFSITIHIKECTPEGEEMIKCGKLNLVDLAGSENISRSGARDNRAREAGEINKSLLTLGRVINALVEHSGHIPYRDSKLTRLLRDSLGGKTKTCVIATISPSIHCLEETLNTLDYAQRAKYIKNKPEVNRKMMKSTLIKDLYCEIDRLKQELHAAREKNGIYIPKDCFIQDEASKKAMSEKLERLEVELELRNRELAGLKDLCNSQKLLHRLLDEKEHSFSDLEQHYKQAYLAIQAKEHLIVNLLKSENMLVDNAFELRSELESAAEDISGLFSKLDRKNEMEYGNKIVLQRFHSQLTEQLEILHKTVSTSVTQEENRLNQIEQEVRSFVSAKIMTTRGLHEWIERLKDVLGNGIGNMERVSCELKDKSQASFGKLNSQISTHSSEFENCLKSIAQDGNQLLNELKSSLSMVEDNLTSFTKQQHEGHLRTVEATRSISKISTNFFHNLNVHSDRLSKIMEESKTIQNQKLHDLQKNFEECADNEEKQLLIRIEEMLANSNARKKKLVQDAVYTLQETDAERTSILQKEVSSTEGFTRQMKDRWTFYLEDTENNYREDTTALESKRLAIEEDLQKCKSNTTSALQQWETARSSLLILGQHNATSMESLLESGIKKQNEIVLSRLPSATSTALQDADVACKSLLSAVDCSLKLDHEACETICSLIAPCHLELRELNSGHHGITLDITENAENCLEKEYMVDKASCLTPRRRSIHVPSVACIEELRTPAFQELIWSWEAKPASNKQISEEGKQFSGAQEAQAQGIVRDCRVPLTTKN